MRMKLETFLKAKNLTDEAFAVKLGISQSQVSRIKRGKSWPTRDVLKRIVELTDGDVTADDIMVASPPEAEAAE